jgi:hypothetical protein
MCFYSLIVFHFYRLGKLYCNLVPLNYTDIPVINILGNVSAVANIIAQPFFMFLFPFKYIFFLSSGSTGIIF